MNPKKQKNLNLFKLITWSGIISVMWILSCAKPVSPKGGPKDTLPPLVIKSSPDFYTTNFPDTTPETIEMAFDEFIQLEGLSQKLLISPPLKHEPDIKIRGKRLLIKINDTLKANSTYSIFFSDAVVDLHEKNPIENFQYVFSTGDHIDSLQISGKIVQATNLEPAENILIMLYKNHSDSIPMKELPVYITKSAEDGTFRLPNLGKHRYKIFALEDKNSNYLFDLPNERIAFIDSLLTPFETTKRNYFNHIDTLTTDTTTTDTLKTNTLTELAIRDTLALLLFREQDTNFRITTQTLEENTHLILGFNQPADCLKITALKPDWKTNWYLPEWQPEKDSVLLWLPEFHGDSLVLTLSHDTTFCDTLTFTYFEKNRKQQKPKPVLSFKGALENGIQPLDKPLKIQTNFPLAETSQPDSLWLFTDKDTLRTAFTQTGLRTLEINHPWHENGSYGLYFPDSAFHDIFGHYNDSSLVSFNTKSFEDYGNLLLTITGPDSLQQNVMIALTDKQNKKTFMNLYATSDTIFNLKLLSPGDYKLRGFIDSNKNRQWDSGIYLKHLQPETILKNQAVIEIIGNWDVEFTWKIKP